MTHAALSPAAPGTDAGRRRSPASLTAIEIAHRDGPVTERIAAAAITESGGRETHLRIVLDLLTRYPSSTASQLASMADFDVYEVRRRLTDAKRLGLAVQGAMYRAPGAKQPEMQWWPAERQGALL